MSRLCLDTSAYSNFRRGEPRVVELIDRAEWIGLPTVTLGELRVGFLLGAKRQRNEEELREFLSHPLVSVLAVDEDVSRHFAEITVTLRRAGTPIPTNDVWIAATAVRAAATVVSFDDHFSKVDRVRSIWLELANG